MTVERNSVALLILLSKVNLDLVSTSAAQVSPVELSPWLLLAVSLSYLTGEPLPFTLGMTPAGWTGESPLAMVEPSRVSGCVAEGAVCSFEGVGRGGRSQEHRLQHVGHNMM